jgi:hypothetical protein
LEGHGASCSLTALATLSRSRAFLTLEGVSLQADPDYSIIKSCFPYVAKRLVADDDPRARKALRDLLYGASDAVDVDRLSDLADGFSSYTTTTKTINEQAATKPGEIVTTSGQVERISTERKRKRKMVEAEAMVTLAKDTAEILLNPDGNLIQNVIIEEGALAASAQVKDVVRRTLIDGPRNFRESLPLNIGSILPPLPFEGQLDPFVRKTPLETKAQRLAEKLLAVSNRQGPTLDPSAPANSRTALLKTVNELDAEQAALVLKEIRENVPKYAPLFGRVGCKFMSTLLRTASSNIDSTLEELANEKDKPDRLLIATAKGLSSAAERGASALSQ